MLRIGGLPCHGTIRAARLGPSCSPVILIRGNECVPYSFLIDWPLENTVVQTGANGTDCWKMNQHDLTLGNKAAGDLIMDFEFGRIKRQMPALVYAT